MAELRARFWPKQRLTTRDFRLLLVPGAGLVLSTPVAILFFCVARFFHGEELGDAARIGLLGFLPGFGLGIIILLLGLVGSSRPTLPKLQEDLARGSCAVHVHHAARAWRLVDDGNEETADLLLDLGRDRVLALPAAYVANAGVASGVCTISKLPRSKAVVSVSFSGDPIAMGSSPVVTKDLWRNDDLEWFEPIRLASAPSELRAALERAELP